MLFSLSAACRTNADELPDVWGALRVRYFSSPLLNIELCGHRHLRSQLIGALLGEANTPG